MPAPQIIDNGMHLKQILGPVLRLELIYPGNSEARLRIDERFVTPDHQLANTVVGHLVKSGSNAWMEPDVAPEVSA